MNYEKFKNRINGVGIRIIETGEVFETRTKCAERLGVNVSMVSMCLSGRVKSCRGYHLDIVEIEFDHPLTDDILNELYNMTENTCDWKEHPYRPDIYISSNGDVAKNIRGNIVLKEQYQLNSGYLTVSIEDYRTRRNKNSNYLVHRLVAETYIPNPHDLDFVNHIDGDKTNNRVSNLEWCSRSDNMRHAYDSGLYPTDKVMLVETGEVFNSASDCARAIGGTVSGIHDCKTGRQHAHRGYHFKFFDSNDEYANRNLSSDSDVIAINIWDNSVGYFNSVQEASYELGFSRVDILRVLRGELESVGNFRFEYANREDRLLYGEEYNKLLSWIQIGIR